MDTERNRSFFYFQSDQKKVCILNKRHLQSTWDLFLFFSDGEWETIPINWNECVYFSIIHTLHKPLEEMNMHKIASFQVPSCFSFLYSFALHFVIVDFMCSLYVRFVSKSFVCRLSFLHFRYSFSFAYMYCTVHWKIYWLKCTA